MTIGGKNPFRRQGESTLKLWKLPACGWGIREDRQRESRDAKHWSQHLTSLFSLLHTLQKFTLRFSVLLKSSLFPLPPASCTGCSHTMPSKNSLWKSSSHYKRGMTIFLPQHMNRGSTAGWFCGALISYNRISTPLKSPGVLKNDCYNLGKHCLISQHLQTSRNSNF